MIIGIQGFIGSGKDTVATILRNKYGFHKDSFAASLKDVCANIFDWPRALLEGDTKQSREWRNQVDTWWADKLNIPNFTPRDALQMIGTDTLRNHFNPDLWFLTVENRMRKSADRDVVITDARFPNEIQMIRRLGGKIIQVKRGPEPEWTIFALRANYGDTESRKIMETQYKDIHVSEWAWIGEDLDYVIHNNEDLSMLDVEVTKFYRTFVCR